GFTTCTYDDTVGGNNGSLTVVPRTPNSDPALLFALSDRTQALPPRGNVVGNAYASFLTTYKVDNGAGAPNTLNTGGTCGDAPAANSGNLCETHAPAPTGAAPPPAGPPPRCPSDSSGPSPLACTRYSYDGFGQKASMSSPKANAEIPAGQAVPATT